ncbi:MAG: hypothetical protein U0T36_03125 [Saprospiraceae bacterium]
MASIKRREDGQDCIISSYPKPTSFDQNIIDRVAKDIITNIRDVRNKNGVKNPKINYKY